MGKMGQLRKLRRSLSPTQKTVARSAASHVLARCEGFKIEWEDNAECSHTRLFGAHEEYRAWGWYHAKLRVGGSWVAIYERRGQDYKLIQASGCVGE